MARRTTVGLDIGTSAVRAVQLSLGRGGPTLERFGQVPLPAGAVRDGEVVAPDLVAEALKTLWSSAKFSSKQVVIGVANQKVIVRQVDLPWLPMEELRQSLGFQVQDYIPIPVEKAVLDIHPVDEVVADNGARMQRVLLVAASRDMVMSALEAVQRAGLRCMQVDLTPFAVLRSVVHAADPDVLEAPQAEAVVDVGARVTNILVHERGVPRFVRILLMGGEDVTAALAERMGVPIEEAETNKAQMQMSHSQDALTDHPAARALDAAAMAFVDEVRGSLDYYLAQPGATPVRRVVLSGGGSRLGGLAGRLSLATRLPVEHARPATVLRQGRIAADQLEAVEPVMSVPVGLALGVAS